MQESFNTFNKYLEEVKYKQTMMNNTITEIKNTLEGVVNLKNMHNIRVMSFIWGKVMARAQGIVQITEKLAQRGSWGMSIYVILVKKEFMHSGTYFTKGFLLIVRS